MRIVIWLVAAFLVIYCGYWFVGSRVVLQGAETTLAQMRTEGLGDAAAVSLRGFPSRFDITVDRPQLTSADGFTHWSAPFLQIFALSYKPNHVIVVWPNTQTIEVGRATLDLTTVDMRASAVVGASAAVPLDHTAMVAKDGVLTASGGWGLDFAEARVATRLAGAAGPTAHDIGIEITGITPKGLIAPVGGGLPAVAEHLRLDATVRFDHPIDRHAAATGLRPEEITIRDLSLSWGDLQLAVTGGLTVAPDGTPEGRLALQATEWRAQLRLMGTMGLLRAETLPTVERVLEQVALLSGGKNRLELPLEFRGGRMYLGPVPIGPAPRF
jgi:hypothetical protein